MTRNVLRLTLVLGFAAGLAACASAPKDNTRVAAVASDKPKTEKAAPAEKLPLQGSVSYAIQLLAQGRASDARMQLLAVLKAQPNDATARKLLAQIDTDPKVLLGEKSFSYKARKGDTVSSVAERFLGDPQMFYALARLNGIDPPAAAIEEGRVLQIPGEPKQAQAPARPVQAAAITPPKPQAPARDPARAAQLRSQALVQLNQGGVGRAVGLLQQASTLDPDNGAIKRDLDRALRLQKTVGAR